MNIRVLVMGLVLVLITQGGTALAQDLEGEATATSTPIQGPLLPTTPEPITTPVPGAPAGDVPESGTIADDSGQKVPAKGSETNPNAQQESSTPGEGASGSSVGNETDKPADKAETGGGIPAPWDWIAIVALLVLATLAFGLAYLAFKRSKKSHTPDAAARKEVPAPPISVPLGSPSPPEDPLKVAIREGVKRLRQP